jgi:DNA-binding GntR family transcriptional regulator
VAQRGNARAEQFQQVGPTNSSSPAEAAYSEAYVKIREFILSGQFPPGHILSEAALATACQVSRTPVREALTRLQQDGLVERTNGRLRVPPRRLEEILEIYELRFLLEGFAARSAAERHTPFNMIRISSVLDTLKELYGRDEPDSAVIAAVGAKLHSAIWQASHNPFLTDCLERSRIHLGRYPADTLSHANRLQDNFDEHFRLVEAIRKRLPDEAERIVIEHLTAGRDARLKMYADKLD